MGVRVLLLLMAIMLFCIIVEASSANNKISKHQHNQGHHLNVVKGSAGRRLLPYLDCGGLCKARCSLHSRPNVCTRACGTCCARCKCVPPGTAGNREMCGSCYTDMTTHGNKPKCP